MIDKSFRVEEKGTVEKTESGLHDIPKVIKAEPNLSEDPLLIEFIECMKKTRNKKGHDYANDEDDMANFHCAGSVGKDDAYVYMLKRIAEKCVRLAEIHQKGERKVLDESELETHVDIALLSFLAFKERKSTMKEIGQLPAGCD